MNKKIDYTALCTEYDFILKNIQEGKLEEICIENQKGKEFYEKVAISLRDAYEEGLSEGWNGGANHIISTY